MLVLLVSLLAALLAPVREEAAPWAAAAVAADTGVAWSVGPAGPVAELERMRDQVDAFAAAGDRRATFLTMYAAMTSGTAAAIGAPGRFEDPGWVRALLVHFSSFYFEALTAAEAGDWGRVPPAWVFASTEAASGDPHVLLDAMLGMSAHINHDLPLVTRDLLVAEAAATGDPVEVVAARRHRDFTEIDAVIAEVVDEALAGLAAHPDATGALDRLALSRLDLAGVWAEGVAAWRADAWELAVQLASSPERTSSLLRASARWSQNWATVLIGVDRYLESTPQGAGQVRGLLEDPLAGYRVVRFANLAGVLLPSPEVASRLVLP